MTGIIHFETFVAAAVLLNITPGNDTIFILSRSVALGKKAGIMSVAGIATGSLIHTVLAALGLSIIISNSMVAFNIIKYAGAAYLVYMGIGMLRAKTSFNTGNIIHHQQVNLLKVFRDAVITNVLNPKVALFFISFLPQFIDPALKNTVLPFLMLGATFTFTGTMWCLMLASFAAAIFSKLNTNKKVSGYINKICGSALIALGIKLAFADRK